jgi:mono/diheme cytochrome c family protein
VGDDFLDSLLRVLALESKTPTTMKNSHLLLFVPLIISLSGCANQVTLSGKDETLASRSVTQAEDVVVFPDDNPSIPDGKRVWDKMNCAECHGGGGGVQNTAANGDASKDANKTDAAMQTQPTRAPGERQVVTSGFTSNLSDQKAAWKIKPLDQYLFLAYGDPKAPKHPILKEQLSRREIWDLVFYSRSLAMPFLTDEKWAELDPVFGANCAVCHGKRGHGDGPLARNMEPVPANFHQYPRFYDRTDEQIWEHIAYGIKWEGMPNFLGKTDKTKNVKFDEAYIRQLTNYVRSFHSSNVATLSQSPAGSAPVGSQQNPTPAQEQAAPAGYNKEGQVNTNSNASKAGGNAGNSAAPATSTGGEVPGSKAGD